MSIDNLSYFSKKITFLNVFLTFTIVVLHAKTPERWGLPLDMNFPFIYMMNIFTQIGVPMFFFISGLLFYRNCNFKDLERKLYSRIHSLFVPYILWNVFFVGIFWCLTHIPFIHDKMNMGNVLNNPTEVLYAILNARYTVLWFVKDLMIFCLFSAGFLLVLKKKYIAYLVLLFSFLNAYYNEYGYENVFYWLPMYFMGAVYGKFYSFVVLEPKSKGHTYVLTAFLLIAFLFLYYISLVNLNNLFLYRFFSPIIIWFLVDLLLKKIIENKFVKRKWMRHMFFIFCTHQFLLNVLQKIVVLQFPATSLILNLTFIISPIIVVLLLLYLANLLSKYKFYSYFSGGR